MEFHPVYNGDFIAQAMAELKYFSYNLSDKIKDKNDSQKAYSAHKPTISDWPTYNFNYFQTYTNEKLSSAQADIYISDLDELYGIANECLQKYGQLINQSTRVLRKLFINFSPGITVDVDLVNYPFFKEALFCFKFIEYYEKKNPWIHKDQKAENTIIAGLESTIKKDYYIDRNKIIEILDDALNNATDTFIDFLTLNMLRYKYNYTPIVESYPMFKFKVTQNELCRRLGKIRAELNLGPESRESLAELFSLIPQANNSGVNVFLNKESLRRNMNQPKE